MEMVITDTVVKKPACRYTKNKDLRELAVTIVFQQPHQGRKQKL
jgi:hypothetical protein